MANSLSLSRLDLNLLVALDALLTERSVTRAAQQLHLSQPALSASLARLRSHFDDPLLARRGNTYELTPLATRLTEHTATALNATRRVFESQTEWTPGKSTREFSIYGSDYGFATIGASVSRSTALSAPGVNFRFIRHNNAIVDEAATSLRSVDAMIIPHGHLMDLPHADLWRDRWVVVASEDNREVASGLTTEHLSRAPWAFTYRSRTAFTSATRQLELLGIEPRVVAVVESFLSLGQFIMGTERLGLIQSGLAPIIAGAGGVQILEPPFSAPPTANTLWWDPVHNHDPEHIWMRSVFTEAAAQVQANIDARGRYTEPK